MMKMTALEVRLDRLPASMLPPATMLALPAFFWLLAAPVQARAQEDRCRCDPTEPEVIVTCEPGGPLLLKVREGDRLVELTPEQMGDALLAFEIWDGTRYQGRCDDRGKPQTVSSGSHSPGVQGGIYRLFHRLYPQHPTHLRLLGPNPVAVQPSGKRDQFTGGARICAGPPATVILPIETARKALQVGGPALLAFIMAHELGHRSSAFTSEGDQCFAWVQSKDTLYLDKLADARGAFYAAMAGYSMAPFAENDDVQDFLTILFLSQDQHTDRKAAEEQASRRTSALKQTLKEAFSDFDAFVGIYQTAITLIFSEDLTDAVTLLEWLHEIMGKKDVMVPEVKLALALALMMRARADAPWLEGMPRGMSHLACVPVYPVRPAMSEEMGRAGLFGGLKGPGGRTREDAIEDLKKALRLLEEAADLEVSPLLISAAKACASLYLGNDQKAREEQEVAEKLAQLGSPDVVRKTLAANRDLIEFHARVTRAKRASNWSKEAKRVRNNLPLKQFLQCLGSRRTGCEPAKSPEMCVGPKGAGDLGDFRLTEVPEFPGLVGQCPHGWSRVFSLPDPKMAKERQSVYGVTACAPEGGLDSKTVAVHVRLMGSTRPPTAEADFVVLITSKLPERVQTLDAWRDACKVCRQGVSDLGDAVFEVSSCEKAGVSGGVLFVEQPSGRVTMFGTIR